ncbi:MAG: ribonuclease P protein component [Arsenicicoccus sp.]|nr:MAG: ribonuclease P protein component [Arsenicicoccus sp.]
MLPRRHRLTTGEDFRSVLRGRGDGRRRHRAGTDLLVVHLSLPQHPVDAPATASVASCPRAGLVVSRAVGNAVVRNRVSRRLRHLLAGRLTEVPPGTEVVVRALRPAATASSAELADALDHALGKALARRS